MGLYVILNLEDKFASINRGAADSTVLALRKRYEDLKQRKGVKKFFMGKNEVVEHRCVEVNLGVIGFTKDPVRLAEIRDDCGRAEKIYVVAHGDPRTTDICYTNDPAGVGVVRLASYSQLGAFLRSIITARKDLIRLALIMCYGARCRRYQRAQVDHMGMIAANDLAESFAYQLFRGLAQVWSLKMTAVTGKIQHDATSGRALVEVEEMIDENMEFAEAAKAQTVSKGPLIAQYKALLSSGIGVPAINQMVARYRLQPTLAAATPLEQYAKDLVAWENTGGLAVQNRVTVAKQARDHAGQQVRQGGGQEEMNKYGKFIYTYKKNVLKIVSKYGKPGDGVMRPMTVLYEGPLLD